MFLKIFILISMVLLCEGSTPENDRQTPTRFLLSNSRDPGNNWFHQTTNERPVAGGFPNSFVGFGLNPQTGQIEQTQVVTQTRPGGPITHMIQNMLNGAGMFVGQLIGAVSNVLGGALQSAGQLGQEIQDISNPVTSVTMYPLIPVVQPKPPPFGLIRPPIPTQLPVFPTAQYPSTPSEVPSIPSSNIPNVQPLPYSSKSTIERAIDQALILLQNLQTYIRTNFQTSFESEEGKKALSKINEDMTGTMNKLQGLKSTATEGDISVLRTAQNMINTVFDRVEVALVGITGSQSTDFIEAAKNEINTMLSAALQLYTPRSVPEAVPSN